MGVKLQFNPSTGKLAYTAATGKVQVFDDTPIGDIDPYSTIPGNVCNCFATNSTPRYFTVTIKDVISCSGKDGVDANGTWKCEWTGTSDCFWTSRTTLVPGASLEIRSGAIDVFGYGTGSASIGFQAHPVYIGCDHICDNVINLQGIGNCGGLLTSGYGGTAKWVPYWYAQWEEDTVYSVDDPVSNGGEFYKCTQSHTSCVGGFCPDPDKPGVGSNWEDYWVVSTLGCP